MRAAGSSILFVIASRAAYEVVGVWGCESIHYTFSAIRIDQRVILCKPCLSVNVLQGGVEDRLRADILGKAALLVEARGVIKPREVFRIQL